jgi:hypothetical protein
MADETFLRCDGCGQLASPEHIARRLRRLEWATRYRPLHIQTLLLGGVAPREDAEFLYAPIGDFRGEAEGLLRAVGIPLAEKSPEAVHSGLQSAGFFLTHILECAVEPDRNASVHANAETDASALLRKHLPAVASRVRRSLKPKRVMLVTEMPQEVVQDLLSVDLGCPVMLDDGKPFSFYSLTEETSLSRLRKSLGN